MDFIGDNSCNFSNAGPDLTPFLESVISTFQTKLVYTINSMPAYLAFQLKSEPTGAAFTELDSRIMDSTHGKKALVSTIQELRKTHADDLESLSLCMDTWASTEDMPEYYNEMLLSGVLRVSDLPARYKQDVIAMRYLHTPTYKETQSWLARFPYTRNHTQQIITWGKPSWLLSDGDTKFKGIFSDL